ncbi:hypothetical protein [Acinetobacter sp. ULE_I064]|uniref:hypothetical protein n=1 Tax=Acinetobacter sp. ULE_I064 TaxID=3373071 RepID=UPI003AF817DA
MDNSERLITAFYYSVGGIILGLGLGLGLGLAIFSSLYLSSTISSLKIVSFTVINCFVIGYLFPNLISNIFKWVWKIFVNLALYIYPFNIMAVIRNFQKNTVKMGA